MTYKPVILCILDGWGLSPLTADNAPYLADTPNFDRVMATSPNATLVTYGPDAGLPKSQMGNSEVGHTNIGAGRVVAMDLGQIDLAIEEGSYSEADALAGFVAKMQATGGRAHLMAIVSDGGVHGHIDHLIETLRVFDSAGVPVVVHGIADGRDVAPGSAGRFFETLMAALPEGAQLGTLSGRYYALDRDNRWERVALAWRAMAVGQGEAAEDAASAIAAAMERGESDEFILPTVIEDYRGMAAEDGLFCLNFRADRAREILMAFSAETFDGFERDTWSGLSAFLGMVSYSDVHDGFMPAVFPKRDIKNTLGAWVAKAGLRQFRVAETEKYPHVTFFLNGGIEVPETGEDRFMPPSPKVATYDLQPEMSAAAVTDQVLGAIDARYDLIVVNYANPDMVGHTGDLQAAIDACAAVDAGLGRVLDAMEQAGGAMVLTADHGNCEQMVDPDTGGPHTAHTLNPVPVAVIGGPEGARVVDGRLADLAPTVLALMGLDLPDEMTGRSLLR